MKKRRKIQKKSGKVLTAQSSQNEKQQEDEKIQQEKEEEEMIDLRQIMKQDMSTVPPNLVIKNLLYPKTKSQIIVLGVENINPIHSSYVYDILEQGDPDVILTQLSPDQPFFIKTNGSFDLAWKKFVKGRFDYQFLVNPKPTYLGDITMNQTMIEHFIAGAVLGTPEEFDVRDKHIKTFNHIFQDFTYNTFLTPFIHSYNNPHRKTSVVVNDLPYIKYRDFVVRNIQVDELRDTYKNMVEEYKKGNYNFDPQLYAPKHLLKPKLSYIVETLKHAAYSNKRVISIMDRHVADLIDGEWQSQTDKLYSFDKFYQKDFQTTVKGKKQLTFIEYIEKHVIMDLMFEPILRKFFILNKTFPYIANDTIGYYSMNQSMFVIFEHYYRENAKLLQVETKDIYKKLTPENTQDEMSDLNLSVKNNNVDPQSLDSDDSDYEDDGKPMKNPFNPISMFN